MTLGDVTLPHVFVNLSVAKKGDTRAPYSTATSAGRSSVPLALYRLLKDVHQTLAIVMVILGSLMQTPAYVINTVTDAAALLLVHSDPAMAMLFLRLHHHLDVANAIFAGVWLIPFGLLVYRSRFLPRFLGVWLILGCFGWLAFCVAGILFPGSEDKVFSYGQPVFFGEVVTMFWLVIVGARDQGSQRRSTSVSARGSTGLAT